MDRGRQHRRTLRWDSVPFLRCQSYSHELFRNNVHTVHRWRKNILPSFLRSRDGGSTWTAPLRINDVSNGQHFFPTICSSGGIISVAWYDSRQNVGTTMNSLDVYFSESLDGGVSFLPNIRVTATSFNPDTV